MYHFISVIINLDLCHTHAKHIYKYNYIVIRWVYGQTLGLGLVDKNRTVVLLLVYNRKRVCDLEVMWDDVIGLEQYRRVYRSRRVYKARRAEMMMSGSMYTTLLLHVGHMDVRAGCTVLHSHCGVDMR